MSDHNHRHNAPANPYHESHRTAQENKASKATEACGSETHWGPPEKSIKLAGQLLAAQFNVKYDKGGSICCYSGT